MNRRVRLLLAIRTLLFIIAAAFVLCAIGRMVTLDAPGVLSPEERTDVFNDASGYGLCGAVCFFGSYLIEKRAAQKIKTEEWENNDRNQD